MIFDNNVVIASAKLASSWIKFKQDGKSKLGYVMEFRQVGKTKRLEDYTAIIARIKNEKYLEIPSSSIEYTFGELGYLGYSLGRKTGYISRLPIRRDFRQGLREGSLAIIRDGESNHLNNGFISENLLRFESIINNDYPKLEEALDIVEEEDSSVPISKQFAITKDYGLEYRGRPVGSITSKGLVKLGDRFGFLQQELGVVVSNEKVSL